MYCFIAMTIITYLRHMMMMIIMMMMMIMMKYTTSVGWDDDMQL